MCFILASCFFQESCCQVRFQTPDRTKNYIERTFAIFLDNVRNLTSGGSGPEPSADAKLVKISVTLKEDALNLDLATKEDYTLSVIDRDDPNDRVVEVRISATNFFGARHAFETLSQLITFDPMTKHLEVSSNIQQMFH